MVAAFGRSPMRAAASFGPSQIVDSQKSLSLTGHTNLMLVHQLVAEAVMTASNTSQLEDQDIPSCLDALPKSWMTLFHELQSPAQNRVK